MKSATSKTEATKNASPNPLNTMNKGGLYEIFGQLLHISTDATIKRFERYGLDISKDADRFAFLIRVIRDGNIEIPADMPESSKLNFTDIAHIASNIMRSDMARASVKHHFATFGLSVTNPDDVAFYLSLCYEAERRNVKIRQETTELLSKKKVTCPSCGSTEFFNIGKATIGDKEHVRKRCKHCHTFIVPTRWEETGYHSQRLTPSGIFLAVYGKGVKASDKGFDRTKIELIDKIKTDEEGTETTEE